MTLTNLSFLSWHEKFHPEAGASPTRPFILICPQSPAMARVFDALRRRPAYLWTLTCRGSDMTPCIVPGYTLLDRMGYILTCRPYRADELRMVVPVTSEDFALPYRLPSARTVL